MRSSQPRYPSTDRGRCRAAVLRGRAWADVSVAEAKTSVCAFYLRFRDKDALLHVLQLELHARGAATATSLRVLRFHSRAFVQVAVASYREPRGPRRALLDQVLRYDDHAPTGRKIADP